MYAINCGAVVHTQKMTLLLSVLSKIHDSFESVLAAIIWVKDAVSSLPAAAGFFSFSCFRRAIIISEPLSSSPCIPHLWRKDDAFVHQSTIIIMIISQSTSEDGWASYKDFSLPNTDQRYAVMQICSRGKFILSLYLCKTFMVIWFRNHRFPSKKITFRKNNG